MIDINEVLLWVVLIGYVLNVQYLPSKGIAEAVCGADSTRISSNSKKLLKTVRPTKNNRWLIFLVTFQTPVW